MPSHQVRATSHTTDGTAQQPHVLAATRPVGQSGAPSVVMQLASNAAAAPSGMAPRGSSAVAAPSGMPPAALPVEYYTVATPAVATRFIQKRNRRPTGTLRRWTDKEDAHLARLVEESNLERPKRQDFDNIAKDR